MSVDDLRRRRRRRLKIEEKRRKGESFGRRKSDDAPPTRAAVPSPALFSCTAAAVSRRAARPRPLVSRTPLCEYDDSSFRSLVVLSRFDVRSSGAHKKRTNRKHTFYRERALLNINSNSKTQREKMESLFFFVHKTLLSSRPLNDDDAEQRKGKERKAALRASSSSSLSLSLSLCVCAVSRVVLLY